MTALCHQDNEGKPRQAGLTVVYLLFTPVVQFGSILIRPILFKTMPATCCHGSSHLLRPASGDHYKTSVSQLRLRLRQVAN